MKKFIVKYIQGSKTVEKIIEAENRGDALAIFFERKNCNLKIIDIVEYADNPAHHNIKEYFQE